MGLDAKRIRLIVGLITIVSTFAVVSIMIFAANGAFADDYQLTAQTDRAGFGLDDTSEVKIRGVKVGTVESLSLLDDGTVELTFNIGKDVRIPTEATATIEPLSVFGPKFVDITPGAAEVDGPFLEPGGSLGPIVGPTELAETLDSVAAESAGADRTMGPVALDPVMSWVVASLDHLLDDVDLRIDGPLPVVIANETGLRHVFLNLVTNAVKFADPDRPLVVTVRTTDAGGLATVEVTDNGRGIDPEFREAVFGLGVRAHHDQPGTGLGLATVRRTVELVGGSVEIDAGDDGFGTSVRLSLRTAEADSGAP